MCLCPAVVVALSFSAAAAQMPEDVAVASMSLRSGERATLERTLGPIQGLPTYRADLTLDVTKKTVSGAFSATLPPRVETWLRVLPNFSHPSAIQLKNVKINNILALVSGRPGALLTLTTKVASEGVRHIEAQLGASIPVLGKAPRDFGAFAASENMLSLVGLLPQEPFLNAQGQPEEGPSAYGDLGIFPLANIIFSLSVPTGWRVISAGTLIGEVSTPSGETRFTYAASGVRELPMFAVKNLVPHEEKMGDVTVEGWAQSQKSAQSLANMAKEALALLDKNIGPYPFKTFRIVEVPLVNGAGGMEFQGLVTIATSVLDGKIGMLSMFQDPMLKQLIGESIGPKFDDVLEFTVNHEVAHQYFAGLVGSDPVRDPVADEPLAQFVALKILEWKHGAKAAREAVGVNFKMAFQMSHLMGVKDTVARQPTGSFDSSMQYAAVVYGKAPLVFVEQEKLVSAPVMLKALKRYATQYRYRTVDSRAWLATLQQAAPSQSEALQTLDQRYLDEVHGDEDVGGFDLGGLLGTSSQLGQMKGVDRDMMKMLQEAAKALSGE
jgi:hypothetical protein